MQYFLAYLLQVILELKLASRPLLLLSDEPDFALSATGQRDLLRFFRTVVSGLDDCPECQLIYATHSAELIDPNFPDRITVLRKGHLEEGTTIVDGVYKGLFEPVRSAIGGRVCSLPFLDGPNLVVEGGSERMLVVRMSQFFAKHAMPYLDLSYLTIVDSDGTGQVANIVVTAKSIAGDKAYLTILLDNDAAGRRAATQAKEIDDDLEERKQIVMVDEILGPGLGKDSETEDLVPERIYLHAAKTILQEMGYEEAVKKLPNHTAIKAACVTEPIVDVLNASISSDGDDSVLAETPKTPVIGQVFDLLDRFKEGSEIPPGSGITKEDFEEFEQRLVQLTSCLLDRINDNLRHKRHDEVRRSMMLRTREFTRRHRRGVARSKAADFLDSIRELGLRIASVDQFGVLVDSLIEEFKLREEPHSDLVEPLCDFLQKATALPTRITIDERRTFMGENEQRLARSA